MSAPVTVNPSRFRTPVFTVMIDASGPGDWIVVTAAPSVDRMVSVWPPTEMFSVYVPGATSITSLLCAAVTAAWIVAYWLGTDSVAARATS